LTMSVTYLRRYTDITSLIYLLRERKITLVNPQSWDDSNDSYYLELYREKKNLRCVLALCFTRAAERYHYWRVFAYGLGGVCVRFDYSELLDAVRREQPNLRTGTVRYLTLKELLPKRLATEDLPFLKRSAFRDEKEFRLIYGSERKKLSKLDVSIPLSCIDRIKLNPWIDDARSRHVKWLLRSVRGCGALNIVGSNLLSSDRWKRCGDSAV
jgi:hypothetical protein